MTHPTCPICGARKILANHLLLSAPPQEVRFCPNGPEDSPYHKLFLELVAVRKIVFRYKHDNASIREQLAAKDARIAELESALSSEGECWIQIHALRAQLAERDTPCVWLRKGGMVYRYCESLDGISAVRVRGFCPDCGHPVEVKEEK